MELESGVIHGLQRVEDRRESISRRRVAMTLSFRGGGTWGSVGNSASLPSSFIYLVVFLHFNSDSPRLLIDFIGCGLYLVMYCLK